MLAKNILWGRAQTTTSTSGCLVAVLKVSTFSFLNRLSSKNLTRKTSTKFVLLSKMVERLSVSCFFPQPQSYCEISNYGITHFSRAGLAWRSGSSMSWLNKCRTVCFSKNVSLSTKTQPLSLPQSFG